MENSFDTKDRNQQQRLAVAADGDVSGRATPQRKVQGVNDSVMMGKEDGAKAAGKRASFSGYR